VSGACAHGRRVILVVDDDPDLRLVIAEVLEDDGYEVMTAENGRDAIEQIASMVVPPLLVVLDLMMPVADGYAVLRSLRHELALDVPVIIFSAQADLGAPLTDPVRAVLRKPISLYAFLDAVRALVETGASGCARD